MTPPEPQWALTLYRFRWPLTAVALGAVATLLLLGVGRVGGFGVGAGGLTERIGHLGDTSNGSGAVQPLVFDPRMDLWFGSKDPAVEAYREIERTFVAEDYVIVSFEETESEFGVFGRDSLAAIARLTEAFLRVPGVRHVRSLTSNPWIRYGDLDDGVGGTERGLVISDLVEGEPHELTDDAIIERMVAVLGAERVAQRLGEERVRDVLGADASFADHQGEPLLLGTIVDETGTTTAVQIQVLRPRVDEDALAASFAPDDELGEIAPTLYSIQAQRAAVRGIEHILSIERGWTNPSPERAALESWIASLPLGEERHALEVELSDPTRSFMLDANEQRVRKFFDYRPDGAGGWVDTADPANPAPAPAGFAPEPKSHFEFHIGGVPLFERNFEDVGMSDSKYMVLMFAAITVLLAVLFRRVIAVAAPLFVVFAAVAAMAGAGFAAGKLFNNMTIVAPNMLTAVAIADAVHLVASWAILRSRYTDKRALIVEVLRRNGMPVFLTSVTTAVGFFSLMISEIVPVSMFGALCGFGTLFAYALSMSLVPAMLSLVPERSLGGAAGAQGEHQAHAWQQSLADFVVRKRGPIVAASGVLLVVGAYGLANLRIDSDFRAMFPPDNPVMSDFNWIESRLGGVGDLEIVFDGGRAGAPVQAPGAEDARRLTDLRLRVAGAARGEAGLDPLNDAERAELQQLEQADGAWNATRIAVAGDFLAQVDRLEARLREEMADESSPLSVVTDLISPLDVLRRMHQVQNGNRSTHYRVPRAEDVPAEQREPSLSFDEWTEEWLLVPGQTSSTLAAQYYLQYENGARPGENLSTQVSMDRTRFRIQGRLLQAASEKTVAAAERIREIAETEFPGLVASVGQAGTGNPGDTADTQERAAAALDVSGKMLLYARTNRIFTEGFVKSMGIALTIITILIGIMFRSARMAFVSLIPNVLPILLPLSIFGLLRRPLDAPAIFVSSVALGVCVDDTIHFFTKFLHARRRGDSVRKAVCYVFETAGVAISVTSVILVIGFGTLVLSDFSPNWMMGTLAAAMISLAWVADIIVTPAVLSYVMAADETGSAPVPDQQPEQPDSLQTV